MFFLGMLVAFYIRQHIGYFALSTAFLVVYVMTLISWVIQKRNVVSVYENGIRYKKFSGLWDEIESGTILDDGPNRKSIELQNNKRQKVSIPSSIQGFDSILGFVKANVRITS